MDGAASPPIDTALAARRAEATPGMLPGELGDALFSYGVSQTDTVAGPGANGARGVFAALADNLAHPPWRSRRFWRAQGLVLGVVAAQLLADSAQDAHLIPVPGFVWYLFIFLPVIYAGTAFGLAGSLATALEATIASLPNELLVHHSALAHWAGFSTIVMADVCALLLGDRFERNRREQARLLADERSRIAGYVAGHPLSWRHLLGMIPDGVALIDEDETIRFVNAQLEMLAGYTRDDLLGRPLSFLVPGVEIPSRAASGRAAVARTNWQGALTRRGGDAIPADLVLRPILVEGVRWVLVDVRDDRPRREAEAALAEAERRERTQSAAAARALADSEQRFRLTFESNMSGIVLVDTDDRVLKVNEAFCRLVGYEEDELVGRNSLVLTDPRDRVKGDEVHARLLAGELEQVTFTKRYRHKDGRRLWVSIQKSVARDDTGAIAYFVCSVHDVTGQRLLTDELNHQARHDPLTGLANRRLFEERLSHVLGGARVGTCVGVMLLDLDNFKAINDTLGHHAGDELLIAVARRLEESSRRGDHLFRLGGDEFLYLAEGISSPEAAERIAERLLAAVAEPICLAGQPVDQRASVGIALLEVGDLSSEADGRAGVALRNADIALYEAKRRGKGRCALFSCAMREEVANRFELGQALTGALRNGELSMHYQPIVHLDSARPCGFEALMRWQRPDGSVVPPSTFIPIAERSDSILELGRFALREALAQARNWPTNELDGAPLHVAVNVSPRQLFAPRFAREIGELLAEAKVAPDRLVLEVTEGSLIGNVERASRILDQLQRRGVRVALDDFGTGHSSLSRLALLRPSILKIDRSFVSPERPAPSIDALLETMVTLGRRLDMVVVAEGIETPAQRDRLLELGCELGQGYHFSPALPAGALTSLLDTAAA